jgi:hypothetical protein
VATEEDFEPLPVLWATDVCSAYYFDVDGSLVWASYLYKGCVYTADHVRGIDILKLTPGAASAKREVVAPPMSRRQRAFLARMSTQLKPDPATAGLCFLAA